MEIATDTGDVSSVPIETPEATTFGGDQEGLEEAAAELARRREARAQERPEAEPEEDDRENPEVTKLRWQDGRDPNTPITVREAVRDLSAYRKEQKEQLLQEIQSQWDAYQQAE